MLLFTEFYAGRIQCQDVRTKQQNQDLNRIGKYYVLRSFYGAVEYMMFSVSRTSYERGTH